MHFGHLAVFGLAVGLCECRGQLWRRQESSGSNSTSSSAWSNSTSSSSALSSSTSSGSSSKSTSTLIVYTTTSVVVSTSNGASTSPPNSTTSLVLYSPSTPNGSSSGPPNSTTTIVIYGSSTPGGLYSSAASNSAVAFSTPYYTTQSYIFSPSSSPAGYTANSSRPGSYTPPGTAPHHYSPSQVGPGTAPWHPTAPGPSGYGPSGNTTKGIFPTGTGYGRGKGGPTVPTQGAHVPCSGETLNVLNASLNWWYTQTLYRIVSTLTVSYNQNLSTEVWSLLPSATPFDLTSALQTPICTTSYTFNSKYNQSLPVSNCTPAPTPVAAGTTVLSQTAYKTPNATIGYGNPPSVISTPTPAAITIPKSGGTYTQNTGFVFFSKYEIATKSHTTYANGSAGCAAVTRTFAMDDAFSFEYNDDNNVNGSKVVGAGVTGDVNPAFLGVVGASSVQAGSWVAAPTVALVVQNIVVEHRVVMAAAARPGFEPKMTTETILQTPSATLPSFNTPSPSMPPNTMPPASPGGGVQKTQKHLQTPTPPNQTPGKPGSGPDQTQKPKSPNNPNQGQTQPNSPGNPGHTNGGQPNGGKPTTTNALSVLESAAMTFKHNNGPGGGDNGPPTTTNALSVLESAESQFTHTDPTAAAIINGLHHHTDQSQPTGAGNQNGGDPNNGNPGGTNSGGNGPGGSDPKSGSPSGIGPVAPGEKNGVGSGPSGKPVIVVGGHTITGNANSQFNVGHGKTLTQGGTAVVHGHKVSLATGLSAIVVDDRTHMAAPPTITPAPIIIDGHVYHPNSGTTYHISGQQLTPGGAITMHRSTISLVPGGTAIVVNGRTQDLSNAHAVATTPPLLTIGGHTYTAINNGGTYVVDGKTLVPGGVITNDGTTVSLAPGATAVVIDGHTHTLAGSITAAPVLTVGGHTYTATNGDTYVISGKTLVPGGVITDHGTTISLEDPATAVVINGHTSTISGSAGVITAPPVLTIGGKTFTAVNSGYTYVINGETLTPGEKETVTVGGTTYIVSLYPGASVLQIETEGANGKVTATMFETLQPTGGVQATAGSQPSGGPSASVTPAASNMASSSTLQFGAIGIGLFTFVLAIWL